MRTCPQTKKRLSSALEKAREVLQAKKHRRKEDMLQQEASKTSNHPVVDDSLAPLIPETTCAESQDLNQPLAIRRVQRQNRQLPKRYRDIVPEPPTPFLPASSHVLSNCPSVDPSMLPAQPSPACISPVKRILNSARNIFGLFPGNYSAMCRIRGKTIKFCKMQNVLPYKEIVSILQFTISLYGNTFCISQNFMVLPRFLHMAE
jgi:hypothetical protein